MATLEIKDLHVEVQDKEKKFQENTKRRQYGHAYW